MPQLGLTMEEGTVSKWVKQEGDAVKVGDVLLEITTDKLTSEVTAEAEGTLIKIVAQEGEDIPVKGLLAYIGEAGEQVGAAPAQAAPVQAAAPAAEKKPAGETKVAVIGGGPGGYVAAIRAAQLGGKVTLIDGDKTTADFLNKWYEKFEYDKNAKMIAHVLVGLLPESNEIKAYCVIDERIYGAACWGIGHVSSLDMPPEGQPSDTHVDVICPKITILFDDKLIMENGEFVHPEFKAIADAMRK